MANHEQPSKHELAAVFYANRRDAQIGSIEDGISPDVARDIGYTSTPEDLHEIIEGLDQDSVASPNTDSDTEAGKPDVPVKLRVGQPYREIGRSALPNARDQLRSSSDTPSRD